VLFAFGASVAFGQSMFCSQQPQSNCTTAGMNCVTTAAYCSRTYTGAGVACDTSAMTCAGTNCAAGTLTMDSKTCSKCGDTCGSLMTNDTCSASAACAWRAPGCTTAPTPQPTPACSGTTKAACTGEAGCFFVSYMSTVCGTASATRNYCTLCNNTLATQTARSALVNSVGQTCTWTAASPYAQAYSFTVVDAGQNSACPATDAAGSMDGTNVQSTIMGSSTGSFFGLQAPAAGTATCMKASSASEFLPSLLVLGLVAALA